MRRAKARGRTARHAGVAAGLAVLGTLACAHLLYRTPDDVVTWQPDAPPVLSLAAKARAYQERLERRHQMPDGIIRYKVLRSQADQDYGNLADGSFFLGIYLGSQALRHAVAPRPEARQQLLRSLHGMQLLAEVSGRRGLLARYVATRPPARDPRWRPSPTRPAYHWRPDASRDQYAGFVHGLGVVLAALPEAEWREPVAPLAAALADHLIAHDLRLMDADGRTTHGDLRGRILGFPVGVNALIVLAIAKSAAVATSEARYARFYTELVERGYPRIARWAHLAPPGNTKRVNANMAFLALYPLLRLERDEAVLGELQRALCGLWNATREDRNAFFAFVRAAAGEDACPDSGAEAARRGVAALAEFPDDKVALPVDLTRAGFDFPRAWLSRDARPRSRRPIPLYLRPRGSSLWVSDPRLLVGRLHSRGELVYAGIDFLSAYWIGRYHGFVTAED